MGGLKSIGIVESVRELKGKTTMERRCFLTSLPVEMETFARSVRRRGGKNIVHWILDVCFHEDQSRDRTGHVAENLATLRRVVLNLLNRGTTKKRGVREKQLSGCWDNPHLLRLLGM